MTLINDVMQTKNVETIHMRFKQLPKNRFLASFADTKSLIMPDISRVNQFYFYDNGAALPFLCHI